MAQYVEEQHPDSINIYGDGEAPSPTTVLAATVAVVILLIALFFASRWMNGTDLSNAQTPASSTTATSQTNN